MLLGQDVKLDFDDILIVPQRTTLESRNEVALERNFKFHYSPRIWSGIPIMCSNMCAVDEAFAGSLAAPAFTCA